MGSVGPGMVLPIGDLAGATFVTLLAATATQFARAGRLFPTSPAAFQAQYRGWRRARPRGEKGGDGRLCRDPSRPDDHDQLPDHGRDDCGLQGDPALREWVRGISPQLRPSTARCTSAPVAATPALVCPRPIRSGNSRRQSPARCRRRRAPTRRVAQENPRAIIPFVNETLTGGLPIGSGGNWLMNSTLPGTGTGTPAEPFPGSAPTRRHRNYPCKLSSQLSPPAIPGIIRHHARRP